MLNWSRREWRNIMSQQAVDVVLTLPKSNFDLPALAGQQLAWLHATRIRLRGITFEPAGEPAGCHRLSQSVQLANKASSKLAASTCMLEASNDTLEVRQATIAC